jgi:AraC-like DNA-binding protein
MRSSVLREFQIMALAFDLDPLDLMRRVGIDLRSLDDPEATILSADFTALLKLAAEMSGIEDFGLRFGEARGMPDLGPVALMMREEPTVRDALLTLSGLMHLHNAGVYIRLEERPEPIMTLDIYVDGDLAAHRQIIDSALATSIHVLRWLLGEEWAPSLVCTTLQRPKSTLRYDRFMRSPIDFRQEFNGVAFWPGDLDKPLPASSPIMRRQVERYIRSLDIAQDDAYLHRVMRVVAMGLARGEARADQVARYLRTDRRTLNRRLSRVGHNYSTVLETVRKNIATQQLLTSNLPLSDIAPLVGFESLRAFSRWFHSAFHTTASEWRRSQHQGSRERGASYDLH